MVRRGLHEVARLVAGGVDRLAARLDLVSRLAPAPHLEGRADDALTLEEVDEVVQPVDQEALDPVGLAGERVGLAGLDAVELAEKREESEPGAAEELRAALRPDDEADVRLVLERLPGGFAYGKTQIVEPCGQRA